MMGSCNKDWSQLACPTWAAVGRVGKSKMGTSDAAAGKGREEGVRRVWRTKGTP